MQFARFGVLATCAVLWLSACSSLEGDKVDYKSASKGTSLEVPPDLNQLSRDSRYAVPNGPVNAIGIHVAPLFTVYSRFTPPEVPRNSQLINCVAPACTCSPPLGERSVSAVPEKLTSISAVMTAAEGLMFCTRIFVFPPE